MKNRGTCRLPATRVMEHYRAFAVTDEQVKA